MTTPVPTGTVRIAWDGDLTQAIPADFKGVQVYIWRSIDGPGVNQSSYVGMLDNALPQMYWPGAVREVPYSAAFTSVDFAGNVSAPAITEFMLTVGVDSSVEISWVAVLPKEWSIERVLPVAAGWQSVTYGNGVFVAVAYGFGGTIAATSPDGITWTQQVLPVAEGQYWDWWYWGGGWQSVTYGNGVFVAIAYGMSIAATSSDGVTWTQRVLPVPSFWQSVTYGNGVFVAVANSTTIAATSPDGITWTQQTLPASVSWQSVTYGNGVFVAVAAGWTVAATSPDGVTWTQRTLPTRANWYSVTYGNGVFVAVAYSSTIAATSPDGITWTQQVLPVWVSWYSVTYGGGVFVAVANNSVLPPLAWPDSAIAATSPDGVTWTQRELPVMAWWSSVAYGNGVFVAVAHNDTIAATTTIPISAW